MSNKATRKRVRLAIAYPLSSSSGATQRRVASMFYSAPPITAAEIELMIELLTGEGVAANNNTALTAGGSKDIGLAP